jgi:hypothetical protein
MRSNDPILPNRARNVAAADEPQSTTADDGQVANGYARFAARVVPTRRQYWDQRRPMEKQSRSSGCFLYRFWVALQRPAVGT